MAKSIIHLPTEIGPAPAEILYASVDESASGDHVIVAARPDERIRVMSLMLTGASDVAITWKSGSENLSGPMTIGTAGFEHASGEWGIMETEPGQALTLNLDSSVQVSGALSYVAVSGVELYHRHDPGTVTNPFIFGGTAPSGIENTPYEFTPYISGGQPPYSVAVTSGNLPAWAHLDTSTGEVTGTPTVTGNFSFTLTATDALSESKALPVFVSITADQPAPDPLSFTGNAPAGVVGDPYSFSPTITGGTSPYTVTVSVGSLPSWASINAATGAVTGTPDADGTTGFTLKVTDAASQTKTLPVSITIVAEESDNDLNDATFTPVFQTTYDDYPVGTVIGTISGLEDGSTFELVGDAVASGYVTDEGTDVVIDGAITGLTELEFAIRETNGDYDNSPHDTEINLAIEPAANRVGQFVDYLDYRDTESIDGRVSDSGHVWETDYTNIAIAMQNQSGGAIRTGQGESTAFVRLSGIDLIDSVDIYLQMVARKARQSNRDTGIVFCASGTNNSTFDGYALTWHQESGATDEFRLRKSDGGAVSGQTVLESAEYAYTASAGHLDYFRVTVDKSAPGEATIKVFTTEDDGDSWDELLSYTDTSDIPTGTAVGAVGWATSSVGPNNGPRIKLLSAGVLGDAVNPIGPQFYYVDRNGGDDSNDGKSTTTAFANPPRSPQATGKAAVALMTSGSEIRFKGGEVAGNIKFFGGVEGKPITYIGDDWGDDPAVITWVEEVTGIARAASSKTDTGGLDGWADSDVKVLDGVMTALNVGPYVFDNSEKEIYRWAALPKNVDQMEMEDITTAENWYRNTDVDSITTQAGDTHAYEKLIVESQTLADLIRPYTDIVQAYYRDGRNFMYLATDVSVEGDTITIRRPGSLGDQKYIYTGSTFRLRFLNIPSQLEEGSGYVVNDSKIVLKARSGASKFFHVPKDAVGFNVPPHCIVKGFAAKGLPAGHAFDAHGNPGVRFEDVVATDTGYRQDSSSSIFRITSGHDAGVERATFKRIGAKACIWLNSSQNTEARRIYADGLGGALIRHSSGGGSADHQWSDIIGRNINTAHANATNLYSTGEVNKRISLERIALLGCSRPFTIQGDFADILTKDALLYSNTPNGNSAWWHNNVSDVNYDGKTPRRVNVTFESVVAIGEYIAMHIRQNVLNVSFEDVWTNAKKNSGVKGISMASPALPGSAPEGAIVSDNRDTWTGLDDEVEVGPDWETYKALPNNDIDSGMFLQFVSRKGKLVTIDLTDNPKDTVVLGTGA